MAVGANIGQDHVPAVRAEGLALLDVVDVIAAMLARVVDLLGKESLEFSVSYILFTTSKEGD